MSPRDVVYVGHMLDTATKAIQDAGPFTPARQVSQEVARAHPEIPWADIIGVRHKVVHDYLGVDEDIVWQVVTEDLHGGASVSTCFETRRRRQRDQTNR